MVDPTRMEAVSPHFEGMKLLSDVVTGGIVEPTAQFLAGERSQIAIAIDEKNVVVEIVFLGESVQERCREIGVPVPEQFDVQQEFRLDINRGRFENRRYFPERQSDSAGGDNERPDGRRRPLPTLKTLHD